MGRGAGRFWAGTDIFFPAIMKLPGASIRYRESQTQFPMPEDAIVFAMHQGYQVLYFCANDGDDPPVYHHLEQDAAAERKSDRLSDFLTLVCSDDW